MSDEIDLINFDRAQALLQGVGSSKRGLCPQVTRANSLMYAAAKAIYDKHHSQLQHYWTHSQDPYPILYRMICSVDWPVMNRSNVKGGHNDDARGCCMGVSRGMQAPYCYIPAQYQAILRYIIDSAAATAPGFHFSSVQVNINLASAIHVDSANIGPSMAIGLGPHIGGQLWTDGHPEGQVNEIREWHCFNGCIPHANLPYFGQRISIVLFTHSAINSPTAAYAVSTAAENGLPMPAIPCKYVPSVVEQYNINGGMPHAANSYKMLCESTLNIAGQLRVPIKVDPATVDQDQVEKMLHHKGPLNFLHRSIVTIMFYAALITCSIRTASASVAVHTEYLCGHALNSICRSDEDNIIIKDLEQQSWHHTDVHIGNAQVPMDLRSPWMHPLQLSHHHLPLLQCTKDALQECTYGWPEHVKNVKVHMDGSYEKSTGIAAWAFVVVAQDEHDKTWFAGYDDGVVSCVEGDPDFLGAVTSGSDVAEIYAMTRATMWCLQYRLQQVTMCFDSSYACDAANSTCKITANKDATTILAGLNQMHMAVSEVHWIHEHSHGKKQIFPFNEFVDVASKFRRCQHERGIKDKRTPIAPPILPWIRQPEFASWAFLFVAGYQAQAPYPLKFCGMDMYLSATVHPVPGKCIDAQTITAHIDEFKQDDHIEAVVTTCPLLAMHLNPKTLKRRVKRDCFARQLRKDYFICTFPEARSRETGVSVFKTFVVAAAVADEGFGGCEIWLNTKIPIGYHDGRAQYLQPQNVSIIVAKPRLLIIAIRTSCFQCMACCIHAPDSSWTIADIDMWWKCTFTDMEQAIPDGHTVFCGADLNMRIRRYDPPWIGQVLDGVAGGGTDEEVLHKLCAKFQLVVTTTHAENVADSLAQGTFIPNRSLHARRCDYFLQTRDIAVGPKSAKVEHKFQLHAASDDHLPISASFTMPTVARDPIKRRRTATYSRTTVRQDAKCKIHQACPRRDRTIRKLNAVQNATADVESSSQVFAVAAAVRDILEVEYPPEARRQYAPWMTDGTFDICATRSKQWAYLNKIGRQIANAACWFTVKWWAYVAKGARSSGAYKPRWNHTRGPASKTLCMKQKNARDSLNNISNDAKAAISTDFADHAARRGQELVDAAINNDAHSISIILKSYAKGSPMFQERLINENGKFAESYTEERGIVKQYVAGLLKGTHENCRTCSRT